MIRNADYIAAVRLQGAGHPRIILKHVIPMCLPSVIVRTTLDMAGIILTAAGSASLAWVPNRLAGMGCDDRHGREFIFDQWWVAAFPGMAICLVALGFNLLGDGLRDVLDAR